MTTNPPDPIELPERVYGPCEARDIPDGWEWCYVSRRPDPRRALPWYSFVLAENIVTPTTLVWVREPESPTIEIDADLALRLVNDTYYPSNFTTDAERDGVLAAAHQAKRDAMTETETP